MFPIDLLLEGYFSKLFKSNQN